MKRISSAAFALALMVSHSDAALSLGPNTGSVSQNWDNSNDSSLNNTSQWFTGWFNGDESTVSTLNDLDIVVTTAGQGTYGFGDGSGSGTHAAFSQSFDPVSDLLEAAQARLNRNGSFIQSVAGNPTAGQGGGTSAATFFQAIFRNDTSSGLLHGLRIQFDYAEANPGIGTEEVDGLHLYFSWDQIGGWERIASLDSVMAGSVGSPTHVDLNYIFSTPVTDNTAPGTNKYRLMWVDDNGNAVDKQYVVDNVEIAPAPEPSTSLLISSAALALGLKRRRHHKNGQQMA